MVGHSSGLREVRGSNPGTTDQCFFCYKMQILYNTVCCEQCENCKYNIEGHCHGIPYNIVLKSINKLKTKKNDGCEGLTSDISISVKEHRYYN